MATRDGHCDSQEKMTFRVCMILGSITATKFYLLHGMLK